MFVCLFAWLFVCLVACCLFDLSFLCWLVCWFVCLFVCCCLAEGEMMTLVGQAHLLCYTVFLLFIISMFTYFLVVFVVCMAYLILCLLLSFGAGERETMHFTIFTIRCPFAPSI